MISKRVLPVASVLLAFIAFGACDDGDSSNDSPTTTVTETAAATNAATQAGPTLLPSAIASPASTSTPAEGTEFVNAEFGYRLRYPATYANAGILQVGLNILQQQVFSSDGSSNTLNLADSEAIVIVRVADNLDRKTLDAWAAEGGTETQATRVLSTTETRMAGERAIQITADPGMEGPQATHVITYAARDDRVYSIWLFPGSPQAATAHRAGYDLMVSTFEFIE